MKVSKKLLNSILVGVAVGAVSSCTLLEDVLGAEKNRGDKQTSEADKSNIGKDDSSTTCFDCPACGMG